MFDIDADYQAMSFQYYVGGPLDYIAGFTLQAGIPINVSLSTTLSTAWYPHFEEISVVSGSAFLSGQGSLCIEGTVGNNYFTYESRTGNTFYKVKRISGNDTVLAAGLTVRAFTEVTSSIDECSINMVTTDVEGYYTFTIDKGTPWESLKENQDFSFLVMESHIDNSFNIQTPYVLMYAGFLGPVEVTGSRHGSIFKVTAHGWWEYLKAIQVSGKIFGQEKIIGSRTASTTLLDVGTEPTEGVRPTDFGVNNTGDSNKYTLWISNGAPTQTALSLRSGTMSPSNNYRQGIGGPKITQVYCSGRDTNNISVQDQLIIELYNPDNTSLEDQGTVDKRYHAQYWNGFILENSRMQRLYLWLKNGFGIGDQGWEAQSFLYLAHNEKVARTIAMFPSGVPIVELRGIDGYEPGSGINMFNPEGDPIRNLGGRFYLDPRGDWVAIRGRVANRPGYYMEEKASGPSATVSVGGDTISSNNTLTVNSTTGFVNKGVIRTIDTNVLMTYDGIDATHFYNVVKQNKQNTVADGNQVYQRYFHEVWHDFVAWGNTSYWGKYPDGSSGISYDQYMAHLVNDSGDPSSLGTPENQNDNSFDAMRVWGTRDGTGVFTKGFGTNVSPNGINPGASIRRVALIGNYSGPNAANANTFAYMDGGTADDWHEITTPIWGNPNGLTSGEWIKCDLGEHKAATVLDDNSDVGSANGTITVGDDEASEYAPSGSIRSSSYFTVSGGGTGGGVEFSYTHRNSNTFIGVVKTVGAGTDITSSTLTQLVDTNPSTDPSSPPRIEPHNYYIVSHVELVRWKNQPFGTISSDNSDVGSKTGIITLGTGQGVLFPSTGGTLLAYNTVTAPVTGGITIQPATPDQQSGPIFTYTSVSGNNLLGVVKTSGAGTDVTGYRVVPNNSYPSYWTDATVRASRRLDPNDPLTYLGNSTDWEDVGSSIHENPNSIYGGMLGNRTVYFKQSGRNNGYNFQKWIFVSFYGMSDGGRVKVNSLNIYRAPRTSHGDDSDNILSKNVAQTSSVIAEQLLAEAGIPIYQRDCRSFGMQIDGVQISSGSVAQSLVSLAQKTGCVVYERMDGTIVFRDDPRIPTGSPLHLNITIGPSTVWGDVKRTEKSNHSVGQVILTASNPIKEEQYSVTVPNTPLKIGTVQRIDKYFAPDIQSATLIASRIFRRANGGLVLDVPLGMYYGFKPFDIVRVNLDIDDSGVEINRDFVVKGWRAKLDRNGMTGTLTLEEYVTV